MFFRQWIYAFSSRTAPKRTPKPIAPHRDQSEFVFVVRAETLGGIYLYRPSTTMDDILKHQTVLADVSKALTTRHNRDLVSSIRQLARIERADDASAVD